MITFLQMYLSKASEDQQPAPRISTPGAPASARAVALLVHIDCPAILGGQKALRRPRNQECVGIEPLLQSHSWGCRGNK